MSDRSNHIAGIIRSAIIRHRLRPGDKLVERELVEATGVSRVVARQALIRLSEEGLVTWHRNVGASVASFDLTEVIAIFDALTAIEQSVIDRLDGEFGSVEWERLKQHAEVEHKLTHGLAIDPEAEKSADFHILLVALCRNRYIIEFHEKLVRRIVLLNAIYRLEDRGKLLTHDHTNLLELVEGGKIAKAKALVERHYADILRSYSIKQTGTRTMTLKEALAD